MVIFFEPHPWASSYEINKLLCFLFANTDQLGLVQFNFNAKCPVVGASWSQYQQVIVQLGETCEGQLGQDVPHVVGEFQIWTHVLGTQLLSSSQGVHWSGQLGEACCQLKVVPQGLE